MHTPEPALRIINASVLPSDLDPCAVYRLVPNRPDAAYYRERTDRNIGWITHEEQEYLHTCVVGIAGAGGMGGLLAGMLVRLGIGEVRIADNETFDVSNINRQFGAGRGTIGHSKAFVTAARTREISDDTTLVVYPQGITEQTARHFAAGCDVICDEVEFWAIGSRILLHAEARAAGVSLLNCNTVGFGTRLFLFSPEGFTMESLLGYSYEEARDLQARIQDRTATNQEVRSVMERMLAALVPELPEYSGVPENYSSVRAITDRLMREGRASIIATNPPLAAGFLADHVLFHLLRSSSTPRTYRMPVPAPGCLYFDAGFHVAKAIISKGSNP